MKKLIKRPSEIKRRKNFRIRKRKWRKIHASQVERGRVYSKRTDYYRNFLLLLCLLRKCENQKFSQFEHFYQAGLESSITLLTKWLLGWDQVENAIIFVTAGLGAILSYGVVTLISTKRLLDDRQILLGSCCLCFCNLCFIGTILRCEKL